MPAWSITPNSVSYNAAISAAEKVGVRGWGPMQTRWEDLVCTKRFVTTGTTVGDGSAAFVDDA